MEDKNLQGKPTKPTEQQMAEWKEKFKVITLQGEFEDEVMTIIAKKPSRVSFERYQEEVLKKGIKAMRQFVKENILFPDPETVEQMFKEKPGLVAGISNPLQEMMGAGVDFTVIES